MTRSLAETAPKSPSGGCAHCGLAASHGEQYCCYGCELAAQIAKEGAEEHEKTKATLVVSLLLSMIVMMLSLFLFSEDVYDIREGAELSWLATGYRWTAAILSTPVILLLGVPIARRALSRLAKGRFTMDVLVSAGAFAAYGISVYSILAGRRGVYFDSATSALLLATLGRYLEATGRARASSLLGPSLRRTTEPVLTLGDDGFERKSPSLVVAGETLRIDSEEVLPVDARLLTGPTEVNLGVLTGESMPVLKETGDDLPAGAVILTGPVELTALRPLASSTLERLGQLSKRLLQEPSRLQRWADRFALSLTPIVSLIAISTLWVHASRASTEEGVIAALAVVLAACPCTYGVATPLVVWLALRKALEHGVLIRSASVLEELRDVRAVAFDKTGTLTQRALSVTKIETTDNASQSEILGLISALEEGTKHPVGQALTKLAERSGAPPATLHDRRFLPGKGASATDTTGRVVLLGSPAWLAATGVVDSERSRARVALARDGLVLARFHIGEERRPEAKDALRALAAQGIGAFILTGDGSEGAAETASALGIEAHAGLSAEDKVRALESAGFGVAMVGDGLNDAPALAGTRPSFAMHGGTDLARGMAQVSLQKPDLRLVPWTIALAKRALSIARSNLIGSTLYNLLFVSLAATGALKPVWAGASMAISSLVVLASASRMRAFEPPADRSLEPSSPNEKAPAAPNDTPRLETVWNKTAREVG